MAIRREYTNGEGYICPTENAALESITNEGNRDDADLPNYRRTRSGVIREEDMEDLDRNRRTQADKLTEFFTGRRNEMIGWKERRKIAQAQAFRYYEMRQAINAYEAEAYRNLQRTDGSGVRSTFKTDPTARGGIMLADPPAHIIKAKNWVSAINDAWAECTLLDEGDERGYAYIIEQWFALDGNIRPREENKQTRERLIEECGLSRTGFYERLNTITDTIAYHASMKGLL
jgi:hypothetical protein